MASPLLPVVGLWQHFSSNWNEESYPSYSDLQYALLFTIAFPIVRYILDSFVFEKIGRKYVFQKARVLVSKSAGTSEPLPLPDRQVLEKTHIKFKESCWKAAYFLSAEVFSLAITIGEPWFKETKFLWMGPGSRAWPDLMMKLKLKTLYMYVGGFYTYSIFALIFWETRRKDFGVSMTHHVATVILILASFLTRFGRVCSIVVAIHDASDIFLELAKLSKYIEVEWSATLNFVIFAISWAWLRLWYFPRYIIYSTSYEILQIVDVSKFPKHGPILYYGFNFLLIILLYLHIYWWILIARVLWKNITAGSIEKDVRSDDEDEDG